MSALMPLALIVALGSQPPRATPACFPPGAPVNAFEARWFCERLATAGKGFLDAAEGYRVLYEPAFRGTTIIEVGKERSGWLVQTTSLTFAPPGHARTIGARHQRWLTPDEAVDLEWTAKRSGVWKPSAAMRENLVDGAVMVVEARRPGVHRVHVRVLGSLVGNQSALGELAKLLCALGGVEDPDR